MKIIHITPGSGDLYCENCIRDNTLVKELRRQGHDALMVPLYLPILTETPGMSSGVPIFLGGINMYLQQKLSFFRKTPRWIDRLFDSSILLWGAGKLARMTRASDLGEMTLSMLRGEQGYQRKEIERMVVWLKERERPDIICISNALLLGIARLIKTELKVPIVCTLQGEDAFLDCLPEPERTQSWETLKERAREIDAFIAVSEYYGGTIIQRLNLPERKVHVVYNGIDLDGYRPASSPPASPTIGFMSNLCLDKGLGILVEAFIYLKESGRYPTLKLRIAGPLARSDRLYIRNLQNRLEDTGLSEEVELLIDPTRKEKLEFLRSLSVLSVPATYGEPFGLYVIEALASGIPVVQPNHASFPEIIRMTGGGLLCEPENLKALAESIEILLTNTAKAQAMGEQGRSVVNEKFSVERMSRGIIQVFEEVCQS